MTQPSSSPSPVEPSIDLSNPGPAITPNEPAPSYVKLAMRNMVKKGGQSLVHFGLTVVGLLALLVGLAYLTR
ncbi:MAG: DUF3285 domain-containing protein [Leptolyngbya sp. DLM2.Bin15]|nr:MAG: DUF3285 domain-containing protein [Leptolyngbya sp. DLM2.Bin15]